MGWEREKEGKGGKRREKEGKGGKRREKGREKEGKRARSHSPASNPLPLNIKSSAEASKLSIRSSYPFDDVTSDVAIDARLTN